MPGDIREKCQVKALLARIREAQREVGPQVSSRMEWFGRNGELFSELCFCLLTANYTAEGGLRIQEAAGDFSRYSPDGMEALLRRMGHRFPRQRAQRIVLAKASKRELALLAGMRDSQERREWLVRRIKGMGYKEASHFLRNIGYSDVAIIDRHILRLLEEHGFIDSPRSLTRRRYLELEDVLRGIAEEAGMSLGELDLYLWYIKTRKVLK